MWRTNFLTRWVVESNRISWKIRKYGRWGYFSVCSRLLSTPNSRCEQIKKSRTTPLHAVIYAGACGASQQDGCSFYYCTNFNLYVFGPGVFSQSDMNHDWVKAVLDWPPVTLLACISSTVETSCSAGKCPINSQRAGRSGQGQQYSNSKVVTLPRSQVLGVHVARPQGLILTGVTMRWLLAHHGHWIYEPGSCCLSGSSLRIIIKIIADTNFGDFKLHTGDVSNVTRDTNVKGECNITFAGDGKNGIHYKSFWETD